MWTQAYEHYSWNAFEFNQIVKGFSKKEKAKKKNEDVQFLNECINWKTAWLWSNR